MSNPLYLMYIQVHTQSGKVWRDWNEKIIRFTDEIPFKKVREFEYVTLLGTSMSDFEDEYGIKIKMSIDEHYKLTR